MQFVRFFIAPGYTNITSNLFSILSPWRTKKRTNHMLLPHLRVVVMTTLFFIAAMLAQEIELSSVLRPMERPQFDFTNI